MNGCTECLPGVLCLTCGMARGQERIEDRVIWEDDEADTPVARRRDARRETAEEAAQPVRAAWLDTPTCPRRRGGRACAGPMVAADRPGHLHCAACGGDSPATPAEIERATKADAAWEQELEGRRP